MESIKVYFRISDGSVISKEHRNAVMILTKVLFRLDVINEGQALKMADSFGILFV